MSHVVIVGAGLAGYTVARTLRAEGFAGRLTMVGAEKHRPYDRPPLSKAFLSGQVDSSAISLESEEECLDIDWRLGVSAVNLDVPNRIVGLSDGSFLQATDIVIATGCSPRGLVDEQTNTAADVYVVGTLDHANALRAALVPGATVAVAGGGFVGLEVAATAMELGAAAVTVVSSDPGPLHRFGPEASSAVQALHETRCVQFVVNQRVLHVQRSAAGKPSGLVVADGSVVEADVIVAGIGSEPSTSWLVGSGLLLTPLGAVSCDGSGVAAPGIHAAGDCADWAGEACAHWTLAQEQAERVARNIIAPGTAVPSGNPPYVWSDQCGSRLQFAGHLTGDESIELRAGSVETGDPMWVYLRAGIEVAAFGINQARQMMRWRKTHRQKQHDHHAVA